jgi:hypothetical protein
MTQLVDAEPLCAIFNILYMNTAQRDPRLDQLLAAWRRREDARRTGSIRDLAEAHFALDKARVNAYRTN